MAHKATITMRVASPGNLNPFRLPGRPPHSLFILVTVAMACRVRASRLGQFYCLSLGQSRSLKRPTGDGGVSFLVMAVVPSLALA